LLLSGLVTHWTVSADVCQGFIERVWCIRVHKDISARNPRDWTEFSTKVVTRTAELMMFIVAESWNLSICVIANKGRGAWAGAPASGRLRAL
jgi:hypothetical protein